MIRSFTYIAIALALAASAICVAKEAHPVPDEFTISYNTKTDTLSLEAEASNLLVLLARIADLSGIDIKAAPSIDRRVNASFQNAPVEDVIDSLTKTLNVIKSYQQQDNAPGVDDPRILVEVRLLRKGDAVVLSPSSIRDVDIDLVKYGALVSRYREELDTLSAARDLRWQARIEALPESSRARYSALLEKKTQRAFKREIRRLEHKSKREQATLKREEKRKQRKQAFSKREPQGVAPVLIERK